jgi:hypothetical protein
MRDDSGSDVRRILVWETAQEGEAEGLVFAYLLELLRQPDMPGEAAILVPAKRFCDHILRRALPDAAVKTLVAGRTLTDRGVGSIRLESLQTTDRWWEAGIVAAMYASKEMLDRVDSARGLRAAVVLGTTGDEDVREWERTWSPLVHGAAQPGQVRTVGSRVVDAALASLSALINPSTRLGEPDYKSMAIDMFRVLRENGERWDPGNVRAWALRHGWTPLHADQLREVAQGVLEGRRFRGGARRVWRADIIDDWRAQAGGGAT